MLRAAHRLRAFSASCSLKGQNRTLPEELRKPPLKEHLDTLAQIRTQDLEPDPDGGGGGDTRIREGVAADRPSAR
ncbi:MAG: hypothetical protein ABSF35_23600 [Polyangia bacterium]